MRNASKLAYELRRRTDSRSALTSHWQQRRNNLTERIWGKHRAWSEFLEVVGPARPGWGSLSKSECPRVGLSSEP